MRQILLERAVFPPHREKNISVADPEECSQLGPLKADLDVPRNPDIWIGTFPKEFRSE
jgi:hypothetical protein